MQELSFRLRRWKEEQVRPVAVEMCYRANVFQQIVKYLEKDAHRFIRSGHVWCQTKGPVPHITSIIVEENKYIRCEMTPTSVGGEQQECRGILEKKEEKQWIT